MRIIEVDREGKIVKEVKPTAGCTKTHRQMRCARKTANGSFIVRQYGDGVVREYGPTGDIIREIPQKMAFGGIRLPNGNTLIATGDAHRIIEVDSENNVVWNIGENDLPGSAPLSLHLSENMPRQPLLLLLAGVMLSLIGLPLQAGTEVPCFPAGVPFLEKGDFVFFTPDVFQKPKEQVGTRQQNERLDWIKRFRICLTNGYVNFADEDLRELHAVGCELFIYRWFNGFYTSEILADDAPAATKSYFRQFPEMAELFRQIHSRPEWLLNPGNAIQGSGAARPAYFYDYANPECYLNRCFDGAGCRSGQLGPGLASSKTQSGRPWPRWHDDQGRTEEASANGLQTSRQAVDRSQPGHLDRATFDRPEPPFARLDRLLWSGSPVRRLCRAGRLDSSSSSDVLLETVALSTHEGS